MSDPVNSKEETNSVIPISEGQEVGSSGKNSGIKELIHLFNPSTPYYRDVKDSTVKRHAILIGAVTAAFFTGLSLVLIGTRIVPTDFAGLLVCLSLIGGGAVAGYTVNVGRAPENAPLSAATTDQKQGAAQHILKAIRGFCSSIGTQIQKLISRIEAARFPRYQGLPSRPSRTKIPGAIGPNTQKKIDDLYAGAFESTEDDKKRYSKGDFSRIILTDTSSNDQEGKYEDLDQFQEIPELDDAYHDISNRNTLASEDGAYAENEQSTAYNEKSSFQSVNNNETQNVSFNPLALSGEEKPEHLTEEQKKLLTEDQIGKLQAAIENDPSIKTTPGKIAKLVNIVWKANITDEREVEVITTWVGNDFTGKKSDLSVDLLNSLDSSEGEIVWKASEQYQYDENNEDDLWNKNKEEIDKYNGQGKVLFNACKDNPDLLILLIENNESMDKKVDKIVDELHKKNETTRHVKRTVRSNNEIPTFRKEIRTEWTPSADHEKILQPLSQEERKAVQDWMELKKHENKIIREQLLSILNNQDYKANLAIQKMSEICKEHPEVINIVVSIAPKDNTIRGKTDRALLNAFKKNFLNNNQNS